MSQNKFSHNTQWKILGMPLETLTLYFILSLKEMNEQKPLQGIYVLFHRLHLNVIIISTNSTKKLH